ncbi:hypothetical protein BT69DRAFT_797417 [Atractiella rhizophila]|nr:hypothetical protein BT69DRAFT_797417 [Atractiella rhizophila]
MRNKRASCIEHFVADGATGRQLAPCSISRVKLQQHVSCYVDHEGIASIHSQHRLNGT